MMIQSLGDGGTGASPGFCELLFFLVSLVFIIIILVCWTFFSGFCC